MPRVLGIDPGSQFLGWAVLDVDKGKVIYIDSGCLKLKSAKPLFDRLQAISEFIFELVKAYQPQHLGIEKQFVGKNINSALTLGKVEGVCLGISMLLNMTCNEYQPTTIKKAVTGNGKSSKETVKKFVCNILSIPQPKSDDESDALAIAFTTANRL